MLSANDSAEKWLALRRSLPNCEVKLGQATSQAYVTDPRMLSFISSRYLFAAKMLSGKDTVLEVGCGDGFGAPIVADEVGELICTDIDIEQLADNASRCTAPNVGWQLWDFRKKPFSRTVDAIYMLDVIEHVYDTEQEHFLDNVVASLTDDGVLVIGTPNVKAAKHASANSREAHVNLQSADDLY